jgi:succinyl-CoA synthetase beta subunit
MRISDFDAYKLLEKYAIPVARHGIAENIQEAEILLENMECPVFMKIDSPDITNKTQLGLVKILHSEKDLFESFHSMMNMAKQITNKINGVIFQEIVNGFETMVFARHGESGYVVMFGTGGPIAEIVDDASFRIVPFSRFDARIMIKETKIHKLFEKNNIDIEDIAQILLNVSRLVEREKIKEMNIDLFVSKERIAATDVRAIK